MHCNKMLLHYYITLNRTCMFQNVLRKVGSTPIRIHEGRYSSNLHRLLIKSHHSFQATHPSIKPLTKARLIPPHHGTIQHPAFGNSRGEMMQFVSGYKSWVNGRMDGQTGDLKNGYRSEFYAHDVSYK